MTNQKTSQTYLMYLRVVLILLPSNLHSLLVNVYLAVCDMFLHFKRIFENISLQL